MLRVGHFLFKKVLKNFWKKIVECYRENIQGRLIGIETDKHFYYEMKDIKYSLIIIITREIGPETVKIKLSVSNVFNQSDLPDYYEEKEEVIKKFQSINDKLLNGIKHYILTGEYI